MTRKELKDNLQHRQKRKQMNTLKSTGKFKKLTKNYKPPKLTHLQHELVQALKNKQTDHRKTIQHLQQQRRHIMQNYLAEQPSEEIVEADNSRPQFEERGAHETQKYYKQMKKVIESCDIILEVLDARDPLSCRCLKIQRKIMSMPDKKIILVLNKVDLVPAQNAYAWQTYLRREYPVVIFKANLQKQNNNLSSVPLYKKSIANNTEIADTLIHSAKAIGPDHLVQLIKQLSKVQGHSRAVTVGLIGYPNVGKSSVINSLKRSKTCEVSSVPGCTKNLKEVKLDSQVKLLDCPGVIFEKELSKNQTILQHNSKADNDLQEVIEAIMDRVPAHELAKQYGFQTYTSTTDFLAQVCKRIGKLGKGGVPELKQGAKHVVQDWNKGKIKFFTYPPLAEERDKLNQMEAEGKELLE